jgi:hypothetical protein
MVVVFSALAFVCLARVASEIFDGCLAVKDVVAASFLPCSLSGK